MVRYWGSMRTGTGGVILGRTGRKWQDIGVSRRTGTGGCYWDLRGGRGKIWGCMRKGTGGVILESTGKEVARYWRCM